MWFVAVYTISCIWNCIVEVYQQGLGPREIQLQIQLIVYTATNRITTFELTVIEQTC